MGIDLRRLSLFSFRLNPPPPPRPPPIPDKSVFSSVIISLLVFLLSVLKAGNVYLNLRFRGGCSILSLYPLFLGSMKHWIVHLFLPEKTTSHSQVIQYNSSFVILYSIYAHIHHTYFRIQCIPLYSDKNRHMIKNETVIVEGSA